MMHEGCCTVQMYIPLLAVKQHHQADTVRTNGGHDMPVSGLKYDSRRLRDGSDQSETGSSTLNSNGAPKLCRRVEWNSCRCKAMLRKQGNSGVTLPLLQPLTWHQTGLFTL